MKASTTLWACTSAGGCAASFVEWSLPYLQWIGAVMAITAGVRAYIVSRRK